MSSRVPLPPIPPPPPTWRERLQQWVRRQDRRGRRAALLVGAATLGAVLAVAIAASAAVLLQPRFTALELGAQRLAPRTATAAPPVEVVGRYRAFDRSYAVTFPTPDAGLRAVLDNAQRQRWQVVETTGQTGAVLYREGVTATVDVAQPTTEVRTVVADWVRVRQRQAVAFALVLGAGAGAGWVWSQLRRQPRAVRDPRS